MVKEKKRETSSKDKKQASKIAIEPTPEQSEDANKVSTMPSSSAKKKVPSSKAANAKGKKNEADAGVVIEVHDLDSKKGKSDSQKKTTETRKESNKDSKIS